MNTERHRRHLRIQDLRTQVTMMENDDWIASKGLMPTLFKLKDELRELERCEELLKGEEE